MSAEMSRSTRIRASLALLALLVGGLGAGPPRVERVRVPSARVDEVFPPGTELRGASVREFEALLRSAAADRGASGARPAPRLLRALHRIEWVDGVLVGRSEFRVENNSDQPMMLGLTPWTPALSETPTPTPSPAPPALRSLADGRLGIRCEPGPDHVYTADWRLRAHAGSDGKAFALGLPACAISEIVLDAPKSAEPSGLAGVRSELGPGARPDRTRWRVVGPIGGEIIELILIDRERAADTGASWWAGGTAAIDVTPAGATWTARWTLTPRGSRRDIVIELDPRLEFLGVEAPGLITSEVGAAENGPRRLALKFSSIGQDAYAATIRARCPVPEVGVWPIPTATPRDAIWTGGMVSVRLEGTARVLESCRELSGPIVAPRPKDLVGITRPATLLIFDPPTPGQVAELTFRKPRADVSAEVRGMMLLGREIPRLEARVTWNLDRGQLSSLPIEIPAPWIVEKVRVAEGDESVPWQVEPELGGAGSRLIVSAPASLGPTRPVTLNVSAFAPTLDQGRARLSLPRVKPIGVMIADERWAAWIDRALRFQLTQTSSLEWLDPKSIGIDPPEAPGTLIGWRWLETSSQIAADLEPSESRPDATTRVLAHVGASELTLDVRIELERCARMPRSLEISGKDWPAAREVAWRCHDGAGGVEEITPGNSDQSIVLPEGDRHALTAHVVLPWTGEGPIPLPLLPDSIRQRAEVLVAAGPGLEARVEGSGLWRLDPISATEELRIESQPPDTPPTGPRWDHAFAFTRPGPRAPSLKAKSVPLESNGTGGVILDAVLTDSTHSGLIQLAMRVAPADAETLELTLPPGCQWRQARIDGRNITPFRHGDALALTMPDTSRGNPTCLVQLDYSTPERTGATVELPPRPALSMPCLAFIWELNLAPDAVVAPVGASPALVLSRNAPPLLTDRFERWVHGEESRAINANESAGLERLAKWREDPPETLAELIGRYDSGAQPILVDRLALRNAGWGPRASIVSGQGGATALTSLDWLNGHDLRIGRRGGYFILTTRTALPEIAVKKSALDQAVAMGSDPSDRFRSFSLWCASSGLPTVDSTVSSTLFNDQPAWLLGSGWPDQRLGWTVRSRRALGAIEMATACFVLLLACAARRRSVGSRVRLLILAIGAILAAEWANPELASGLLLGTLAGLGYWVGATIAWPRRRRSPPPLSSLVRPAPGRRSGALLPAFLILAWGCLLGADATPPGNSDPILVISTDKEPDRVILRRSDFDRLRALAAEPSPEKAASTVTAIAADHTISATPGGLAVAIESRYELVLDGPGPAAWAIPLGTGRDVSALRDGQSVALVVQPDTRSASLWLREPGRHQVVIRQLVNRQPAKTGARLDVPIPIVAGARVRLKGPKSGPPIELTGSRGGAIATPEDGVIALLGPSGRISARWPSEPDQDAPDPIITVETLALWDVQASGDRVQARLSYRGLLDRNQLRFEFEPGMVVRSATIPGLVAAHLAGTPEHPIWVAELDPPLSGAATVQIELWRPIRNTLKTRQLPRFQPLDVATALTTVGFRRPSHWNGRIGPQRGAEIITDDAFVKLWGPLPTPELTFAGAARMATTTALAVDTVPVVPRGAVRSHVSLAIEAGRLVFSAEARITELEGRLRFLRVGLPNALRLVRVAGPGLVSWSPQGDNQVLLRLDGGDPQSRTIRIEGWLPLTDGPIEDGRFRLKVPELDWSDVEIEPGELDVRALTGTNAMIETAGGESLAAATAVETPGGSLLRVEPYLASTQPVLRWATPPSEIQVDVATTVTLHPDSAELNATLEYRATRGPLPEAAFSIPRDWCEEAQVVAEGITRPMRREDHGDLTLWSLETGTPIWGPVQIRIRAWKHTTPGSNVQVPGLLPRGRGQVTTLIALANASGRAVRIETEGLSIQPKAADDSEDNPPLATRPPPTRYRVMRDLWRLEAISLEAARAAQAAALTEVDHIITLNREGGAWGFSSILLAGNDGPPELRVFVPDGIEVLGAAVDRRLIPSPLRTGETGVIPFEGGHPNRVELAWRRIPAAAADHGMVPLPTLAQRSAAPTITIFAPENVEFASASALLVRLSPAEHELRRATSAQRRLELALSRTDSNSPTDPTSALRWLSALERSDRRLAHILTSIESRGNESINERIRALRATTRDLLSRHPLKDAPRIASEPVQTDDPDRRLFELPRLGTASLHTALPTSPNGPITLEWKVAARPLSPSIPWLALFLILMAVAWWLAPVANHLRYRAIVPIAVVPLVIAAIAQPVSAAVTLGAAALGRYARGRP